jgi:predicted PurR-regulated permease PerM
MPGNPFTDPNWAADLADTVERVVGSVRAKTTKPLVTVTRGLVYGLLVAILGIAALVLLIVMLTRGTQELLDQFKVRRSAAVYISYLAVGGIFSLLGLFVLSKRYSKD